MQPSHELVVSVRDAMEAHDRAYFDAHILHCNINIANIVTSATGRGLLVDWDLSIELTSVRPTGTWQCMSAAVLRDSCRIQTIEDDRDNHDELSSLASYLAIYDQVDHRLSKDVATGGLHKGDQFASAMFPIFTQNRLLFSLRKTFSVHYGETYPDDEIQEAKDLMAQAEANPAMNPTIYYWLAPYIYVSRMEALKKPNWLVEVFNRHLESDDWPSYDKAAMNPLT